MRKLLCSLIFVFTLVDAGAQVFSPMQLISESPDDPLIVIAADLNNDGYDDVIYSSIGDNEISCNLFDPAGGGFGEYILLGTQFHYCTSLFPADLNNDGLTDILAVSQTSNKVGWYKNNGNGSFSLQPFINEDATHAASVTAADIDSDGDMDVISAQKGDNTVLLYLNDGNGLFDPTIVITSSAQIPVVVTTADLNNDTFPDIIAGYGQSDKIVYFLNNGNGSFQPEITITDQADLITNIITADLDNDGFTDIVSASRNDNKVAWYKNLGESGNFSAQIIISQTVTNVFGLAGDDFDLDGDIDIAASSPNDDRIYLFENDELTFQSNPVSTEVIEPQGLAAGDFNNDGLVDIAAVDSWDAAYNNKIYWFVNGKSCFVVHNINQSISSWHLALNDYNTDGNIDIFYSDGQSIRYVDNQNSGGQFSEEHVLFDNGYNITDLAFADADNDGTDDLFVADAMGDRFFWFKNTNGTFGDPVYIDMQSDGPVNIDFSDIDGDNNMDALVALINQNEIALYLNTQGSGNFTKTVITDTVNSPYSVCFSDFDLDGDEDIFYSDYNYIAYLVNDGYGNFTDGETAVFFGTYSTKLIEADINNDGYPDIVCNPDYAHWLENNHDGTFTSHETETWGAAYDVATGDMNNDGAIDILSASGIVNRAYYLKNIDQGETFEINTYAVEEDIRAVLAGDINNDGYADMILGTWPAESLSWAENYYFRIINEPKDTSSCEGEKAFFSVVTAGVTQFQWQMNDGNGWSNIEDGDLFDGANKALLKIKSASSDLFGNQFRCNLTDEPNNSYFTQPATLFKNIPAIVCVDDQTREADNTNTYTAVGNEFDPDTVFIPCNEVLTLLNDYNNQQTLAGEVFEIGSHFITWEILNDQNDVIDSCTFELTIEPYTSVNTKNISDIAVYPNPFTGYFKIDIPSGEKDIRLEVSDMKGSAILQQEIGQGSTKIDLNGYQNGIYFLRFKSIERVHVVKVVKKSSY